MGNCCRNVNEAFIDFITILKREMQTTDHRAKIIHVLYNVISLLACIVIGFITFFPAVYINKII